MGSSNTHAHTQKQDPKTHTPVLRCVCVTAEPSWEPKAAATRMAWTLGLQEKDVKWVLCV